MQQAHASMGFPFDRIISLPLALRAYNKTRCDQITVGYMKGAGSVNGDTRAMKMKLMFTVVLMALMGSTLFINGFLRTFLPRFNVTLRMFLGRYNLDPIARFLLHFAFFQFIPLLSSVLSNAEGQDDDTVLLLIILWLLLVELIRKKVQRMMLPTDGSSFSRAIGRFTLMDYSDEASRLVWVGYLIYSNLHQMHSHSVKAMFVILWSLGFVKLVQRVVNRWQASSSWHTARNPLLIAGYMQQIMEEEKDPEKNQPSDNSKMNMSDCKFAVMGEDTLLVRNKAEAAELKLTTTPGYGYGVGRRIVAIEKNSGQHQAQAPYYDQNEQKHVHLLIDAREMKEKKKLITVSKIWHMKEDDKEVLQFFRGKRRQHLEDLCLSFSLFKMLRRRFEHYPMVEVGSTMARRVMLEGLLNLEGYDCNRKAQRPFQVLQLELEFLNNYYQQAATPVVMAQHILFFCNSTFSMIFLLIFVAVILTILIENHEAAIIYCATMGLSSIPSSFPSIFLSTTMLLALTVIAIETYEFWTLFVFSNWNIVRLLCTYSSYGRLAQTFIRSIITARLCSYYTLPFLAKTSMKIQQVSIVDACGVLDKYSARTTHKKLPNRATTDIISTLKAVDLHTGIVRLPQMKGLHFDREPTSTEIILACHLATELFEMTEHRYKTKDEIGHQAVASALSKYCMYLVAHMPQLLPDDEAWASDRHEDMRSCLELVSKKCCGVVCAPSHHCRKANAEQILEKKEEDIHDPMTRSGVKLFRELERQAAGSSGGDHAVWKDLANFWVGLLVYLAPSNDVGGHAKALASWGGGLITCLWALCTHAGITRQPLEHKDEHGDMV
ncbi:uncharacterized protein LOC133901206 [Phragmites australis]|uniref:uncharacterized protein LOC133901206 n=1 Tax=Phragmites australis TaxID=29695 RepID=UPI002D77F341|nr:uncharacterized protein LOC133901206 [Phragmites australis]